MDERWFSCSAAACRLWYERLLHSPPPSPPQLQHEKAELEQHLEQEQEFQVNKLMKKIKKMENETIAKQLTLEQVEWQRFHRGASLT